MSTREICVNPDECDVFVWVADDGYHVAAASNRIEVVGQKQVGGCVVDDARVRPISHERAGRTIVFQWAFAAVHLLKLLKSDGLKVSDHAVAELKRIHQHEKHRAFPVTGPSYEDFLEDKDD